MCVFQIAKNFLYVDDQSYMCSIAGFVVRRVFTKCTGTHYGFLTVLILYKKKYRMVQKFADKRQPHMGEG